MTADPGRSGGEGTGWHFHGVAAFRNDACELRAPCEYAEKRPAIVVDPVTARDTIARAVWKADGYDLDADWFGSTAREMRPEYLAKADAVLAALASQERGDG